MKKLSFALLALILFALPVTAADDSKVQASFIVSTEWFASLRASLRCAHSSTPRG